MAEARGLVAGVELGGTKCICILGTGPNDIRAQQRLPTSDPATTLDRIEALLAQWWSEHGTFTTLGIASFGPLDLKVGSPTYGYIKATTKPRWSHTDVAGRLSRRFAVPTAINTDVNGAALAEGRWGAAQGLDNFAYITVGTGVGVGLVVNGAPVFGCAHPEMGHIRVVRLPGDTFAGSCLFHGDCVEGLASGTAIQARVGRAAEQIPPDHFVWNAIAHALGQQVHNLVLTTAPQRIIIGGGVMTSQPHLLSRVREQLRGSLNGYVEVDELLGNLDRYIVTPGLGDLAGPLGALTLASKSESVPAWIPA
jgi:fructokinase